MKRKVLACVVACATLFLGMGYAYWTNSLQINTTANTGKLEVKFVDLDAYGTYADENGWAVFTGIPGNDRVNAETVFADTSYNLLADPEDITAYLNSIAAYTKTTFSATQQNTGTLAAGVDDAYQAGTITSDTINVNLSKMYPGFAQLFRADILNTGTIAAKLANMKVTVGSDNPSIKSMIGVSMSVLRENHNTPVRVLNADGPDKTFTIGGQKFVRLSALTDSLIKDMTANVEDFLYLYPNNDPNKDNTMDVIFGVAMDPDYTGVYTTGHTGLNNGKDDSLTQMKNANASFQFLWDQFNTKEDITH